MKTKVSTTNSKSGKVFIYNGRQMNFYLECGLVPLQIGTGVRGDTFAVFKYLEHEQLFSDWLEIKDTYMLNLQ